MRRPLLGLAAACATGCLLADGEAGPAEALALIALGALLLGLALAAGSGRGAGIALGGAALSLGAAAAGVEALQLEARGLRRIALDAEREGRAVRLVGTVRGDAVERAGRVTFAMDVAGIEADGRFVPGAGRARVDVGGRAETKHLADGDGVAAWVSVRAPPRKDAARTGLSAFGHCKSARLLEPRVSNDAGPVRRAAARLREAARGLRPVDAAGTERRLVRAMVWATGRGRQATAEAFRASGTYHVLALSAQDGRSSPP
jgi:hypothetical protein